MKPHATRCAAALDFITAFHADKGFMPTTREIARGLGIRSHSRAHALVGQLVARGDLRRIPGRQRNLQLVKTVCCPNCQHSFNTAVGR